MRAINVELYTTGCPRCKVLESKLNQKNITYTTNDSFDENELLERGFESVPVLKVDDQFMNFTDAVKWINEGAVACR